MSQLLRLVAVGLFSSMLAACSPTTIVTTWRNPAFSPAAAGFTKVLALATGGDKALRHVAEDDLCAQVKRSPCKPAYWAIPDSILRDVDAVKAIVRKEGFDGAIVFRVMDARESATYAPPSYDTGFWDYYAPGVAFAPAYFRETQLVFVEVAIYSIPKDKLLWVAATNTVNPKSVDALVKDVSAAVRKELEREGAIPAAERKRPDANSGSHLCKYSGALNVPTFRADSVRNVTARSTP